MPSGNECAWCRKTNRSVITVRDATLDGSHVDICPKCLPEVLATIPEASALDPVFTKVGMSRGSS